MPRLVHVRLIKGRDGFDAGAQIAAERNAARHALRNGEVTKGDSAAVSTEEARAATLRTDGSIVGTAVRETRNGANSKTKQSKKTPTN